MVQEKFKLPRSSFEELCKIIKAYGQAQKAMSLSEISAMCSIGSTIISSNNSFLFNIGIIEGKKAKQITKKGLVLARALEFEKESELRNAWRVILKDNEFLNKMVIALKIRKGLDITSFEVHIAYSAGEKKSKGSLTGARTVINIFQQSGLVYVKDDKVMPSKEVDTYEELKEEAKELEKPIAKITSIKTEEGDIPINLNIQLKINATPDQLEGLGEKIKKIIRSIKLKDTGLDADNTE